MATSPSLPTYGITCSYNTSSLFEEICMFTELPLGDWFPFTLTWHKQWTTQHLAAWNHTAKLFPHSTVSMGRAVVAAWGWPPTYPKGWPPISAGTDTAPKHFQVNWVRDHPLVLLTGCPVKPCSFCVDTTQGQRCPPIFLSCVTVNLALVGRKLTFTVFLQQNKTSR